MVAAVGEAGESPLLLLLLLLPLLLLLLLGVGLVAGAVDGTLVVMVGQLVSATVDGAATTDGSLWPPLPKGLPLAVPPARGVVGVVVRAAATVEALSCTCVAAVPIVLARFFRRWSSSFFHWGIGSPAAGVAVGDALVVPADSAIMHKAEYGFFG